MSGLPYQFEELRVGHFDVPGQVPGQVDHGHDTLEALQLVELVALDGQLVLARRQRTDVPGDVIAPTDGLHPVDTARVDPDQVAGSLQESVHGHVLFQQVLDGRPPRAVQVVDVVPEFFPNRIIRSCGLFQALHQLPRKKKHFVGSLINLGKRSGRTSRRDCERRPSRRRGCRTTRSRRVRC